MWKLLALAALVVAASAGIDPKCLHAICMEESNGCNQVGCRFDESGEACGYFQIHEGYWIDCGKPGLGWRECTEDKACSEWCVKKYMERYGTYCTGGTVPTCEDYARIHNGGPFGCRFSGTLNYWNMVQAHLQ